MDNDSEAYILLLLSDSNLPTGSFVASAGLESYVTHGFFPSSTAAGPHAQTNAKATIDFVRDSLSTYARSALPFVADAHQAVERFLHSADDQWEEGLSRAIDQLRALDNLYEAMTLNHVARRASKSQGVALLTLYTKGFSRPSYLEQVALDNPANRQQYYSALFVDRLKLEVRREQSHGHLPTCWGVLTASLELSLERSQFLHLFLQARSLLSASVRLNTIGPYAAQQLLLHAVRPLVETEAARCRDLRTGSQTSLDRKNGVSETPFDETIYGPAVTWPLGEILAARHDLQHSRIFNS